MGRKSSKQKLRAENSIRGSPVARDDASLGGTSQTTTAAVPPSPQETGEASEAIATDGSNLPSPTMLGPSTDEVEAKAAPITSNEPSKTPSAGGAAPTTPPAETNVLDDAESNETVAEILTDALMGGNLSEEVVPHVGDPSLGPAPFIKMSREQWDEVECGGTNTKAEDNAVEQGGTTMAASAEMPAEPTPPLRSASQTVAVLLENERKRADDLEARLQASEAQRQKLAGQLAEARENMSDLWYAHENASKGRHLDRLKYEDRMKDKDELEAGLRARIHRLEEQLIETNRYRAQAAAPERLASEQHARYVQAEEDLRAALRREQKLIADLESERSRAARLDAQLMEGLPDIEDENDEEEETHGQEGTRKAGKRVQEAEERVKEAQRETDLAKQQKKALLTELKKTQEALQDSQSNLWKARSEINRLNLNKFRTANEFLDRYSGLLDPQSQLYQNMVAIADYRDRVSKAPTDEQRAGVRLFRDFLEERTEVLRRAMAADDPRPVLKEFDDRWEEVAIANDWGAMVFYKLSATRTAAAVRFQSESNSSKDALQDMMKHAKAVQENMGDAYNGDLVDRIIDLNDEMERTRRPRGRPRA